jgi:O-antigen/teichoic acid export membrane protein
MSGARLLAGILTIAIPLVLVRVIAQSEFGHYKALFLVALTLQTLLALGVPGSLYYFVPRKRREGHEYHTQSLFLLIGLGVVGGVLVLAGGGVIERLFHAELARYMPLLALFVALSIPAALMPVAPMVDRRTPLAARLLAGLDLIRASLIIAAALVTRDLYWIMAAACLAIGLQLALVLWYLVQSGPGRSWRPATGRIREQLRYALPYSGAAMIGFTRQKLHAYYVGAAFSAETFAIYAAATIQIPLVGRLSQTIEEVVILENAAHYSADRKSEMRRVWHRASHLLGLIVIPVWLIAEAFAPELITLLYGQPYAAATPIFRVFLFILPLSIFLGSPMLRAVGDTGVMVLADTFALAVSLGVLIGFAGEFGPLAAVASLVAGKTAYMFAAARRTAQRVELRIRNILPWGTIAGVAGVAFVSAFVAEAGADWVGLHAHVKLLAGGATAVGLFASGSWLTGLIPDTEKRWLRALVSASATRLRPAGGSRVAPGGHPRGPGGR